MSKLKSVTAFLAMCLLNRCEASRLAACTYGIIEKQSALEIKKKIRPVGQAVKTSPSHGENRGSSPLRVTTSRRAFWFAVFLCKNTASLCRLPLLFREKSRLLRLCLCERRHDASAALSTFHGCALRREYLFCLVFPHRSGVRCSSFV